MDAAERASASTFADEAAATPPPPPPAPPTDSTRAVAGSADEPAELLSSAPLDDEGEDRGTSEHKEEDEPATPTTAECRPSLTASTPMRGSKAARTDGVGALQIPFVPPPPEPPTATSAASSREIHCCVFQCAAAQ